MLKIGFLEILHFIIDQNPLKRYPRCNKYDIFPGRTYIGGLKDFLRKNIKSK